MTQDDLNKLSEIATKLLNGEISEDEAMAEAEAIEGGEDTLASILGG